MNPKLFGFAKDSFYYALGDWLNKLSGLILVPILSRIFLPSDYGIIDILNYTTMFLLGILSLNIDSGMQKFYYLREGERRKALITSTMAIRLAITCSFALIAILFAKHVSLLAFDTAGYGIAILWLALCLPIEDMNGQLMLYLRLERRPVSFIMFNSVQVFLQPATTCLLVITYGFGVEGVFIARFCTVTIISALLMITQKKNLTFKLNVRDAVDLLKFSLPGLPAIIQANIMNLLPRYFLAYFSALTAVGLFGTADKIAKTIDMFKTSFNRAWNPFAFSNAGEADERYLYEKVFKLFASSLVFLVVVLSIFAKDILSILTPPKYHSAATLIGGLSIYYALRGLTLIFSTALYSANKVAHTSLLATINLSVFLASAVLLVPRYGTTGLVLSLNCSIMAYFSCYALVAKRYFCFSFSGYRLLTAVFIGTGCIVCAKYAPLIIYVEGTLLFITKLLLAIVFSCLSYYVVLTKEERQVFAKKIRLLSVSRTIKNAHT